jgi:integrase
VSEATGAEIEHLGLERGHRTLTITRKGGKVVTIPLAPRTAPAIDLAVGVSRMSETFVHPRYVFGRAHSLATNIRLIWAACVQASDPALWCINGLSVRPAPLLRVHVQHARRCRNGGNAAVRHEVCYV